MAVQESAPVYQLLDDRIFSFAVPASHRAKWKDRTIQFGRDASKMESLVPFLLKLKPGPSYEIALKNAAHALISGLGLLFVLKDEGAIADIIDLANVKGHVVDKNAWITITMQEGANSKYCFRLASAKDATTWAVRIDVRSAEAKKSTLRSKKVYEDALARLKTELEQAKRRKKAKKADTKRQPLSAPIALQLLSNSATPPEVTPPKSVCAICYEYYDVDQNTKETHFATHDICAECISQYMQMKIGSGTTKIKCMVPECSIEIPYPDIKRQLGSDQLFSTYDERLFREKAKEDPNFRWCANPSCTAPTIIDPATSESTILGPSTSTASATPSDEASYFICPSCATKTCFSCSEYAHPKRTCEEYKKYIAEIGNAGDAPTVAYLNQISVSCWKCKALLQRTEGCVLIYCLSCEAECCAGCGGKGHGHECRRLG